MPEFQLLLTDCTCRLRLVFHGQEIVMKVAETRGVHKCAEKMEREAASLKRLYCCTTAMNIISSLLSVASLAFCILLSLQTSEIKDRVLDLETGHGEHVFHRVPGFSGDQFNSLIQERVDELLSQVSISRALASNMARLAND